MENSRFKFRAWDKERKKFFTSPKWVEFQIDLYGVLSAKNFLPPHLKGEQQLTIMQYTGIKDSKGVEIFEGDVIEDTDYEGIKITGSIVYILGAFYIDWNTYPHSLLGIGTPTIVGNIYENKELLKEV